MAASPLLNAFADWLDNDPHFGFVLVSLSLIGFLLLWVFKRYRSEPPPVPSQGRDDERPQQVDVTDRCAVAAVFGEYAREMPELREFEHEIEGLYVIEVER